MSSRHRLQMVFLLVALLLSLASFWAWTEYVAYLNRLPPITPIAVPTPPGV
jgi:hypothetical protein